MREKIHCFQLAGGPQVTKCEDSYRAKNFFSGSAVLKALNWFLFFSLSSTFFVLVLLRLERREKIEQSRESYPDLHRLLTWLLRRYVPDTPTRK